MKIKDAKARYKMGAVLIMALLMLAVYEVSSDITFERGTDASGQDWDRGSIDHIRTSNGKVWEALGSNIQIAINEVHSNTTDDMGTVQIPSGTYTIMSQLTVYDNITFVGGGRNTILQRGFDGTLIDESSVENVIFENLKFDGNGYSKIMLIFRTGCSHIHFDNVCLVNSGQTTNDYDWGISFYGANFSSFSGTVDGFSKCISLTNQAEYCTVDAIVRPADYIDSSFDGIQVQGDYNNVDIIVHHSGYRGVYLLGNYNKINAVINETGDYGFFQQDGEGNIVTATIRNAGMLSLHSGGGAGIRQGKNNQYQFDIEGSYYDGISVGSHIGAGENCSGNTFIISAKNNNQGGGTRSGLKLYTSTHVTANVSDNVFYGGVLGDDQTVSTQTYGIHITGSGIENNNTFYGFNIFGNTDGGIATGGDDNAFIDFNIHGNGGSAVTIVGSGEHIFSRCKGYQTFIPTVNVSGFQAGYTWFDCAANIEYRYNGTAWVSTTFT